MDNHILQQKSVLSPWLSYSFVHLRNLLTLKTTNSRKTYLTEKRREKRASNESHEVEDDEGFPVAVDQMPPLVSQSRARQVGPDDLPPDLEEDTPRIPSIADPEIPSAGSKLYHACREITTQSLGNQFSNSVLMTLFKSDPPLEWVQGRTEVPVVRWREEDI